MARVIVTGANGFLGSWVTKGLVKQGHEVYALVRLKSDLTELGGEGFQLLYGDVTDPASLTAAFARMDAVFHLAGMISYRAADYKKMEQVNVVGTRNVVNACISCGVRRLVHVSSVVAIGASFDGLRALNETSPYNLGHLHLGYFDTKHAAERLVVQACKSGQLDAVVVNPSTVYGFGDARKGSRKNQIKVALGEMPFYTSGGVNVLGVEDAVQGILSAWTKGRKGERYILSGENITIQDLFARIAKIAGVSPPRFLLPTWAMHLLAFIGDKRGKGLSRDNAYAATMYHWFDNSKARKELDFKPMPAQNAIANSVAWMKKHRIIP